MSFSSRRRAVVAAACRVIGRAAAVAAVCAAALLNEARAEVKLDGLFSDGAVLQQGTVVPVFGTADEGDSVVVKLQGQEATATVKDGHWRAELKPLEAGGPFQLEVRGTATIIEKVYVGEVWVCTGQSNMQWNIYNSKNSSSAIISQANRGLHLYTVTREPSDEPRQTNVATWNMAAAASVSNFSAVGYYFGREVQKHFSVPVGLISCNHYMSTTAAWANRESLEADPALKAVVDDALPGKGDVRNPGVMFNGMVAPISQFAIRGVICYEGESDLERWEIYDKLFAQQIADWRKIWNRPELPFLFVQLAPAKPPASYRAPTGSNSALLREAQFKVWQKTPNTGMIVITDYGDAYTINPTEKEPVGKRLAMAARAVAYQEKLDFSGPIYKSHKREKNQLIVEFDHVGGGLEMKGKALQGFTVAGADGMFVPAEAQIKDNTVIVSAASVEAPEHVRYAWADAPVCNLANKEGLPACPFRSDIPVEEPAKK